MSGPNWRDGAQRRAHVAHWRASGALDDDAWRQALRLLGPWPPRSQWRDVLERLSLWLAAGLLGAAAICFIAANWDALGRFARLAGMQVLLVAACIAAWRLGLTRTAGQAALLLAALLLGGLLALVGQTYQTGADTWQLFALWAGLLVPWLIAAASPPMTLLWLAVANLALVLYAGDYWLDGGLPWRLAGLFNAAAWLAWLAIARAAPSLRGRTGPRLVVAAALTLLTVAALADLFDERLYVGLGLLAWLVVTAMAFAIAGRVRRDVAVLAFAALGVIIVVTALAGRLLFEHADGGTGSVLLLALFVIGQAAAASAWLRGLTTQAPADA